jgi:WD40 repeat protein
VSGTAIASGTQLGPYEIKGLIGAGGMGEVYRAHDGRLKRDVAVKVLPRQLVSEPDRLRRFEREARAAGQLNHPNILAIHDIGTADGLPYFVCELLEGEDLRAKLAEGPIPPRKAISYAIQVARGLAAAHAKGIAHRDLKPENIMIGGGDHVKILDFGLAKLLSSERISPDDKTGPLHPSLTLTGTILGTVSYMSPEQIREQPSDHRTDLFALGSILYEMLTACRAFEGASHADRMSAILHSDPPALPREIEEAAPGIGAVIAHCLEKKPEHRFGSADDLAFALSLVDSAAQGRRHGTAEAEASVSIEPRRPSYRRTTYREGSILSGRFAPDGQAICYGAAWEGRPVELFWAYPGSPESRSLGYPRTDLLSIAPSGEMAVSLRRHARGGFIYTGMLARMPVGGGAPREVLDGVYEADWSPDGRQLAIIREEAAMNRIEYPIGTVLYQTPGWVSNVRLSRDGKHLAFMDHPVRGDDMGSVVVADLTGQVKVVSKDWSSARGIAWSPDGREVIFTAFGGKNDTGRSLYGATLDGVVRPILEVPGPMSLLDISRQGAALIVLENERARIQFIAEGDSIARDLTWLDWSRVRAISADGHKIWLDETLVGGGELHSVYLRGTDGSPAVRLGDGTCFDASPDGQWALAGVGYSPTRLDLLPCGAGTARTIPVEGLDVQNAVWFPDGGTICALGQEPDHGTRLYKVDPLTGAHEPFTDEGISMSDALISRDGRFAAAHGPDHRLALFSVDGGTSKVINGVTPTDRLIRFSAESDAIFVFTRGEIPAKVFRVDLATGERKLVRELSPSDLTGVEGLTSVRMTPDATAFAYSYPQRLNELYVVEGLF